MAGRKYPYLEEPPSGASPDAAPATPPWKPAPAVTRATAEDKGVRPTPLPKQLLDMVSRTLLGSKPEPSYEDPSGRFSNTGASAPAPGTPPPAFPTPTPANQAPFMGPGVPMRPVTLREADVVGREFSYPTGINIQTTARSGEAVSFEMLRGLAYGYDLLTTLIETRKRQMTKVTGQFMIRQRPGETQRPDPDERCNMLQEFFRYPDKRLPYVDWMNKILDDWFITDAPTIYVRRNYNELSPGLCEPCMLEIVDGSTIIPRVDTTGRTPLAPAEAYTQITQGAVTYNYRADELLYAPRNLRPGKLYGYSRVEQVITTVLIGLRREGAKLSYYQTGNIPDMLLSTPADWSAADVVSFQKSFDARMRDPSRRFGRVVFVPTTAGALPARSEAALFGPFDEWLARVCCYAFDLPPLPFVQQQNRATAETANAEALKQGLEPEMIGWKSFMERLVKIGWGWDDIEWMYDDLDAVKPAELVESMLPAKESGVISGDEMRSDLGKPAIGLRHMVKGVGPLGFMFVDDMIKASEMGVTIFGPEVIAQQMGLTAPPPMLGPDGQPLPTPDAPPMLAAPAGMPPGGPPLLAGPAAAPDDEPDLSGPLSGVWPQLLAAVGLGPGGPAARSKDVTTKDELDSDPLSNVVPHPQVLKTLRDAESKIRAMHAKKLKRSA